MSDTSRVSQDHTFVQKSKRSLLRIVFGRTMLILLLLGINFGIVFYFLFGLAKDIPLLFGSVEVFTAALLICVINSRDNPSVKLSWAFIIATVPLLGAVLYFFIRFDLGHRLNRKLLDYSVASSLPLLPEQEALMEKVRSENKHLYNLSAYLRKYGNFPIYTNSDVTYFPVGEEMFREMVVQLEQAEKFIFMEYFLVSEGYMWETLLDILKRKASQGVEVRFLYDGMNAFTNLPYGYPGQMEQLGIRCKMFAPVRPFVSTHYNNRDHRKIMVIDGHTAFTGGINLEDQYINRKQLYGHWKDTAVMVKGDAVQSFTMMFLQMWNYNERNRVFSPYLILPKDPPRAEGYVIPYGDSPMDDEVVGEMVYLDLLNRAKDYVYIMTPYLIPDNELLTALQFAAKRGVDVRLILPGIPDKKTVYALSRSYYRQLLEAGVKIYEYTPGFVHAKVALSDDIHAVVGTINLDYRSLYHHFECAAYLYRTPVLADIRADFSQTLEKCRRVYPEHLRSFPLWARIFAFIAKFAAPLM